MKLLGMPLRGSLDHALAAVLAAEALCIIVPFVRDDWLYLGAWVVATGVIAVLTRKLR